jgi:hypothetical protein
MSFIEDEQLDWEFIIHYVGKSKQELQSLFDSEPKS